MEKDLEFITPITHTASTSNIDVVPYYCEEKEANSRTYLMDEIMSMLKETVYNVVSPFYNQAGNFQNYVSNALNSILNIKKCQSFLTSKKNLSKAVTSDLIDKSKKVLVLDIDETLLHADFDNCFKKLKNYDHILKFRKPKENNTENSNGNEDFITVGLIFRPCLKEFLNSIKENFNVFLYTSAHENYAKAIADLLDPDHSLFKMVFSREDCIQLDNQIYIKNLDYFGDPKNVVILENNMYSFMNHLSNGILTYSFYFDKKDRELGNVLNYLNNYIVPAEDVRVVNENLFHFQSDLNNMENEC